MKFFVLLAKKLEILSSLSCRLVQWTRKHPTPLHPKHLIDQKLWFVDLLKKSDRVLDIGCDVGAIALKVSPLVREVIAFDVSKKAISRANREMSRRGIKNVSFFDHNAEKKFPLVSKSFDVVLLLDVIEHVQNRAELLREIHRVMKDKERLFLTVPNSESSWKKLQRRFGLSSFSDPDHVIEYTKEEIRVEISKAKFKIEEMDVVVYDTWLAPMIDVVGGFSLSLYQRLGAWKVNMAKKNPEDTVGWRIICRKVKA